MRFIQTLKNIWKIEELRYKILLTIGLLTIYRIGSFIVLPGVNAEVLSNESSDGGNALANLLSLFTGGAFKRASIFALGIMPYISASIIMQLMGIAVPTVAKMQKEGDSGRKKITQYTRFLTVVICAFQAPGYIAASVDPAARISDSSLWWVSSVIILTTGTLFVMWLGEKITDKGLGNGTSLIIMTGIIAGLPGAFIQEIASNLSPGGGGMVLILIEIVIWIVIIALTIALVQAVRRIPVQFAKMQMGNRAPTEGSRKYIPLKLNSAGVMPIIFAQAIMFVPLYIAQATQSQSSFFIELGDIGGFWYNFIFFVMVLAFTYFYTAITVNPNQMADDMKKNGGFIPGVKPGKTTSDFIDTLISRITLPGAIFLAFIAILPSIAMKVGVKQGFSIFFGGTSLLILVGVVLDTLQQIESHLLMRHYDGLMKTGKVVGRSGQAYGIAG